TRRLEEEEGRLMKQILELQSKLMRTREQKLHMQRKQGDLFDRGMVEFEKELREGGSVEVLSDGGEGSSAAAGLGDWEADWVQEVEAMSPDSLARLAEAGQEIVGESSRSHP
ncbi:hypothetical protein N0V85_009773, partial [Neurospora sp. IMI 360204]